MGGLLRTPPDRTLRGGGVTRGREVRLASRPGRRAGRRQLRGRRDRGAPRPRTGEVVVRNAFVSVDPYMRGRMNDAKSYLPPFEVGKPMDGGAVGEVVEFARARAGGRRHRAAHEGLARVRDRRGRGVPQGRPLDRRTLALPRRAGHHRLHSVDRPRRHRAAEGGRRGVRVGGRGRGRQRGRSDRQAPRRRARDRQRGHRREGAPRGGRAGVRRRLQLPDQPRCASSSATPPRTASTCISTTSAATTSRRPSEPSATTVARPCAARSPSTTARSRRQDRATWRWPCRGA